MIGKHLARAVTILACLAITGGLGRAVAASPPVTPTPEGDISGAVADSVSGTPLSGGEVRILQGGGTIAIATTDAFGRYVVHNLAAGAYAVEVRYLGYRAMTHGVTVPAGISGSLNELFDPEVVNQIDFQTGGWDAEYGNKNAAIVNVNTRI